MSEEKRTKLCELCGENRHIVLGTKEERIEYYLNSAMRMGAALGSWQAAGDGVVRMAAGSAQRAIKEQLLDTIMRIVREPDEATAEEPK